MSDPVLNLNKTVLRQDEIREGLDVFVPGMMGYVKMKVNDHQASRYNGSDAWTVTSESQSVFAMLRWSDRYRCWTTVCFGRTDCVASVELKQHETVIIPRSDSVPHYVLPSG